MARLKGSSMLEAIVASLIFLIVFALSLTTLSRLTLREDESRLLFEGSRGLDDAFLRHKTSPPGTYADSFEWGKVTTIVDEYEDFENIRQVSIRATLHGSRKTLEIRHLVVGMDAE